MIAAEDLYTVAIVWAAATLIPGPDILVLLHSTLTGSRRAGLFTVLGIALGTVVWGGLAVIGVGTLLTIAPLHYWAIKAVGGAYLIFLGVSLLWSSSAFSENNRCSVKHRRWDYIRRGFLANMSNPKTVLFVASLFSLALPANAHLESGLLLIGVTTGMSVISYTVLVIFISTSAVRTFYGRYVWLLDKVVGVLFIAFGSKLIFGR